MKFDGKKVNVPDNVLKSGKCRTRVIIVKEYCVPQIHCVCMQLTTTVTTVWHSQKHTNRCEGSEMHHRH